MNRPNPAIQSILCDRYLYNEQYFCPEIIFFSHPSPKSFVDQVFILPVFRLPKSPADLQVLDSLLFPILSYCSLGVAAAPYRTFSSSTTLHSQLSCLAVGSSTPSVTATEAAPTPLLIYLGDFDIHIVAGPWSRRTLDHCSRRIASPCTINLDDDFGISTFYPSSRATQDSSRPVHHCPPSAPHILDVQLLVKLLVLLPRRRFIRQNPPTFALHCSFPHGAEIRQTHQAFSSPLPGNPPLAPIFASWVISYTSNRTKDEKLGGGFFFAKHNEYMRTDTDTLFVHNSREWHGTSPHDIDWEKWGRRQPSEVVHRASVC